MFWLPAHLHAVARRKTFSRSSLCAFLMGRMTPPAVEAFLAIPLDDVGLLATGLGVAFERLQGPGSWLPARTPRPVTFRIPPPLLS